MVLRKGHATYRGICKELGAELICIRGPDTNFSLRPYFYRFQIPIAIVYSFFNILFYRKKNGVLYLCAGPQTIWFALFMRWFRRERNKIIMLVADATFDFEHSSWLAKKYVLWISKRVIGIIAASPLIADMAKKQVNCPVDYYVDTNVRGYRYFASLTPDFESKNFIHVGKFQMVKGIDITAKAMGRVCSAIDNKFYILGLDMESGLKKMGLSNSHFVYPGYTDPINFLGKSAFYIQIARLEASGTSVVEAMAAGVIPFVNDRVGHYVLVRKVSPSLVVDSNPDKAAKFIIDFVRSTPLSRLKALSAKCRAVARTRELPVVAGEVRAIIKKMVKNSIS